jgi:primosomal protein N' (replication factor Y)
VVVQTFLPDDPSIRLALKQDYAGFAAHELPSRRQVGLPPYARLARLVIRHQDQQPLHEISQKLAEELAAAIAQGGGQVVMRGPMPCPIARIAGYHRNQIELRCATAEPLQQVLGAVRVAGALFKTDSIAVDVDPVSLL